MTKIAEPPVLQDAPLLAGELQRMNERSCVEGIPAELVREQLARILRSSFFVQSTRLSRFISFVVESTLSGEGSILKEYVIGTEVYDRRPPYQPSQDSIVRSEARRLRNKLKEYYDADGKRDALFIYFRTGSYAPVFRLNEVRGERVNRSKSSVAQNCVSIAITALVDISDDKVASQCARAITEELMHQWMQVDGIRVAAPLQLAQAVSEDFDIASIARKFGVQVVFEGTAARDRDTLRVILRAVGGDGFQMCSKRFQATLDGHSVYEIAEEIAGEIIQSMLPDALVLSTNSRVNCG
jgi:TolB-like protein